jgi:hypothetical protein
MTTCPACDGKRTYTKPVRNIRKSNGVEYASSNPAWVERIYPCAVCSGSGVVSCGECSDTGYIEYEDRFGVDVLDYCTCAAGQVQQDASTTPAWQRIAAAALIDSDRANGD